MSKSGCFCVALPYDVGLIFLFVLEVVWGAGDCVNASIPWQCSLTYYDRLKIEGKVEQDSFI